MRFSYDVRGAGGGGGGGGGVLPFNGFQIFVSQQTGNDSNSGSYTNPLETLDAANTLAGTIIGAVQIIIIDSAIYIPTGSLTITTNVQLIGPTAHITQSDGSDTVVFETGSLQHLVSVGAITNTGGGASLANTGTSNIVFTGTALDGDVRTASGGIFINCVELAGDLNSISTGFINYICSFRRGFDETNVVGFSPPRVSAFEIYVSSIIGDDANNGSFTHPFASIGAAYASLSGISSPASIVIIDNANYSENLTFDNGLVSLIGPLAGLIQATEGDTITTTFYGSQIEIELNTLSNHTGNSALHLTGDNAVLLKVNQVQAGTITNDTADGTISISALTLDCDMVCTSTGIINYYTTERSGTDTPGTGQINGIYPGMATPGISTVIISGTTQTAAISTRYICSNAAQTTVTLPTTFVEGDEIIINGLGAAGYIAQCGAGTQIVSSGISTSVGGSLTSAGQYDSITLTGLLANTTWTAESVVSTGMTPA